MKNQESELIEIAAKIAAWGEAHGMSRAQLVRNFADLGSEKSFRDISAGSLEGYNAENQLAKYRAVYATMEELSAQGGEESIYDDLGTVVKIRRAFLGVVKATGTNRVLIVQGESGIGKTTAVGLLRGKYGTGRISYVEASDVWADSPNAFLGAILRALGVTELPAGRVQRLEDVQQRLSISRRCLVVDEAHHLGPHCLNTVKTLVNTTPGEFILVAIPTLWNKLQAHAYQEAKQIATNRLSERVKLTLDEADVRTYLAKRFPDAAAGDLKTAARIIRPSALLSGNYAFVRDVCRALAGLDADAVSRAVTAVAARR
ncbi:MAG: ATP-binding protein [Kiritimatiellae bacterium]|nr:ATP-binding protein [Kiritimatiellia bacterium]